MKINLIGGLALITGIANLAFSFHLKKKLSTVMAKQDKFNSLLARLNEETSEIAAKFGAALSEIKNGTISDESIADLESTINRLDAIGKDSSDPLPGSGINTGDSADQGGSTEAADQGDEIEGETGLGTAGSGSQADGSAAGTEGNGQSQEQA